MSLLLVFLVLPLVSADIIMPGTKSISHCAKITNMDNYPDYVFFYHNVGPMADKITEIIVQDQCLEIGYKFNSLNIYAIEEDKYSSFSIVPEKSFAELWDTLSEIEKGEMKIKHENIFEHNYDIDLLLGENPYDDCDKPQGYQSTCRQVEEIKQNLATEIHLNYNAELKLIYEGIRPENYAHVSDSYVGIEDNYEIGTNELGDLILTQNREYIYGPESVFGIVNYIIPIICLIIIIFIFIKRRNKK
tara:strand:+ start:59 stop:796 length:738 start_codon:yes stop_codon:yes gene_type:complete